MTISGANDGEILRRPGTGDAPLRHLAHRGPASGSSPGGRVVWLVNGSPRARQAAARGFEQRLAEPGRYDITVLDDSGRYDRVSLSVR